MISKQVDLWQSGRRQESNLAVERRRRNKQKKVKGVSIPHRNSLPSARPMWENGPLEIFRRRDFNRLIMKPHDFEVKRITERSGRISIRSSREKLKFRGGHHKVHTI